MKKGKPMTALEAAEQAARVLSANCLSDRGRRHDLPKNPYLVKGCAFGHVFHDEDYDMRSEFREMGFCLVDDRYPKQSDERAGFPVMTHQVKDYCRETGGISFPVRCYEHGGVSYGMPDMCGGIRESLLHDVWDSRGDVRLVVSKGMVDEYRGYGSDGDPSWVWLSKLKSYLSKELDVLNQANSGDVWCVMTYLIDRNGALDRWCFGGVFGAECVRQAFEETLGDNAKAKPNALQKAALRTMSGVGELISAVKPHGGNVHVDRGCAASCRPDHEDGVWLVDVHRINEDGRLTGLSESEYGGEMHLDMDGRRAACERIHRLA